jgi:hypothetical protein
MNDLTTTAKRADSFFRRGNDLEVAKGKQMLLNSFVDLPCSQTSRLNFAVSVGSNKP